jgi:anthranilate phosphoribosyltransferase
MNVNPFSKKSAAVAKPVKGASPLNDIGDVSAATEMFQRLRQQNAQYDQAIAALVAANRIKDGWDKPAEPEMSLTIQREVLEALGANIQLNPEQVGASIAATGIGFMFAPNHHLAMRNVASVRREMGVRTLFNILGPLTNPAGAPNTLMGVFHPDLVGIQVRVMQRLGASHVLVVHGKDGMDEISLGATTLVGELKDGEVREYEVHPEDFGLQMASNRRMRVNNAEESRDIVLRVLANKPGPTQDIVLLNAGAAIYAANIADSIKEGIARAREVLASGAARARLDAFVAFTQGEALTT